MLFVRQVVTSRRVAGLRNWARWLPEDLGTGLITSCVLTVFLPQLFLVIMMRKPRPLVYWLNPVFLLLSSVRLGCLHFCWSGHAVVSVSPVP